MSAGTTISLRAMTAAGLVSDMTRPLLMAALAFNAHIRMAKHDPDPQASPKRPLPPPLHSEVSGILYIVLSCAVMLAT